MDESAWNGSSYTNGDVSVAAHHTAKGDEEESELSTVGSSTTTITWTKQNRERETQRERETERERRQRFTYVGRPIDVQSAAVLQEAQSRDSP